MIKNMVVDVSAHFKLDLNRLEQSEWSNGWTTTSGYQVNKENASIRLLIWSNPASFIL